jgi:hypothetical protein
VLLMSEGNESVREQYWSLALVSYILYMQCQVEVN